LRPLAGAWCSLGREAIVGALKREGDRWVVLLAGGLLLLTVAAQVLAIHGVGERCDECFLAGTWWTVGIFQGRGPGGDFTQDYIGARRLLAGQNPYPILGPALAGVGLPDGGIDHVSTHPPGAFLFGLPLANEPWPRAARLWAGVVLASLLLALRASGTGWPTAFALVAWGLLWPPAAWSLSQLTPIWLLGQAVAWRYRDRPWLAGAAVGIASLTKFLPAVLLAPFLLRRQWGALAGFAVVWVSSTGLLLWLSPGVFAEYAEAVLPTAALIAQRADNGALLAFAASQVGSTAYALAVIMLVAALVRAARATTAEPWISRHAWGLWAWLAVALLPISWQYSLLPLAAELLDAIKVGSIAARLLAVTAFLAPVVLPWDGDYGRNGEGVVACLILAGMALAAHRQPEWQGVRLSGEPRSCDCMPKAGTSPALLATCRPIGHASTKP
jgi:hypothetical protein